jgi:hypothetical protein
VVGWDEEKGLGGCISSIRLAAGVGEPIGCRGEFGSTFYPPFFFLDYLYSYAFSEKKQP